MYPSTLREEELKNKVAADVFGDYDCTRILGAVDFCVSPKTIGPQLIEPESLLWAEAKTGVRDDFAPLFAQLVLTLGKARTFDRHLPPPFLGAFDCARIAFVPYHEVVDLFYQNDFNWNVAPSDETTREFGLVLDRDQFLWPADTWETDGEFQLDCLVFTLFHGQNRISCRAGGILAAKDAKNAEDLCEPLRSLRLNNSPVPPPVNHWIPFPESEVDAKDAYKSHMNPDSPDAEYTRLIGDLRAAMKELAAKIAPKVREHGFLR